MKIQTNNNSLANTIDNFKDVTNYHEGKFFTDCEGDIVLVSQCESPMLIVFMVHEDRSFISTPKDYAFFPLTYLPGNFQITLTNNDLRN